MICPTAAAPACAASASVSCSRPSTSYRTARCSRTSCSPSSTTGRPRKGRADRAQAALERVGLGHRLDFVPTKLSGGERQRVAIARAIVGNPALLLADEPTGNLDSVNTGAILDLLDELHRDGLTIMVVTHDADVAARAERTLVMKDGELRELATT